MSAPRPSPFLLASCILLALLLGGCAVGPDYKRPAFDTPKSFRGDAIGQTNSMGDMPWWQVFGDDTLQTLVRTALTNNYDIRIAASRVEQASAILAEARAGYFPQVNYQAAAGAGRNVSGGVPSPTGGQWGAIFEGDVNASWQIDLWGRIRRLNESARAQFLATAEARTNVMITLVSTVASDYFQLLALDQELQIARDTTNSYGHSLKLFSERLKGGVSSKLETAAAEAQEASAAATIPDLERQIAAQENQLQVLLGTNPGPILRPTKLLQELLPPDVPPGLPSRLLERRPDIQQAEQLVRSANAQIGVAKANFYPQFSLTALFGEVSPELTAFTAGAANAWSVAANLAGPIFQGGLLKAELRQARASWEEAVLQYQSTTLNALQEVSSALIARQKLARERGEQARAVQAYEEAVRVATERYTAGQSDYFEILQEQELLFPAQNALTQTELNQFLSVIQLYLALGGGWNEAQK